MLNAVTGSAEAAAALALFFPGDYILSLKISRFCSVPLAAISSLPRDALRPLSVHSFPGPGLSSYVHSASSLTVAITFSFTLN